MKLTFKISLLLALTIAAVLLLVEMLTLARESALLEADLRRDAHLVAHTLASAAAESAQPGQLVGTVGADQSELAIVWRSTAELGDVPEALRPALGRGETVVTEGVVGGEVVILAWSPVFVNGTLVGFVEIGESLAVRDGFVKRGMFSAVGTVVVLALLSGVVALVSGRELVGRSVDRLVEKTRQVARGELDHPVSVRGQDELAHLASALNQMSDDLGRLRAEAAMAAQAQLEAEVALRHADRLRTVGVLAAGVAHELGTPLNIISGRAALVRRRLDDPRTQRDADIIKEQVARISELVRRMMDFSSGAAPVTERCDLVALVRNHTELLLPEARKRGLFLQLRVPESRVPVRVDARQIAQVVANLTLNALLASPEGGTVKLVVEPLAGGGARLSVNDAGEGIPVELRERVFDPFFTTRSPGEGTGLGLSIVRKIVEDHRGRIIIEDSPAGGASFVVVLPAAEDA